MTFARSAAVRAGLAGVVFGVVACGYGFAANPGISRLAANRPVQVPAFDNRSLEAEASTIATAAAAREVAVRGALVTEGEAPLVMTGTIERVTATPLFPGATPLSMSQWRVDARIVVQLRERGQPKPIAQSAINDGQNYLSGGDIEATEVSRRLAVQHLLERMATNAVDALAP